MTKMVVHTPPNVKDRMLLRARFAQKSVPGSWDDTTWAGLSSSLPADDGAPSRWLRTSMSSTVTLQAFAARLAISSMSTPAPPSARSHLPESRTPPCPQRGGAAAHG